MLQWVGRKRPIHIPTNRKEIKMRYRVEIYDEVKSNDLTLHFDKFIKKEKLDQLVKKNVNRFVGNIKAYVFDTKRNVKVVASYLPMEQYK